MHCFFAFPWVSPDVATAVALHQDDMVKQRAVDAGANEVRRILQGSAPSRPLQPPTNIPPPDRAPGFGGGVGGISGGAQPMQHNMSAQHGHSMPQADAAQPPPDLARSVSLYVGVQAAPSFNLHQRLKGQGGQPCALFTMPCDSSTYMHDCGGSLWWSSPQYVKVDRGVGCKLCCTSCRLPTSFWIALWLLQVTATCCTSLAPQVPLSRCGGVGQACVIGRQQSLYHHCITTAATTSACPFHLAAWQPLAHSLPCCIQQRSTLQQSLSATVNTLDSLDLCSLCVCVAALTTCTCLCLPQTPRALRRPRGCAST